MTRNPDDECYDTLSSAKNMIDLALLAIDNDRDDLVPTAIEEAYEKIQMLVDEYCIWESN